MQRRTAPPGHPRRCGLSQPTALLEDFHGDPADRILVATAVDEGVPLVTKDERLHAYADRSGTLDARW